MIWLSKKIRIIYNLETEAVNDSHISFFFVFYKYLWFII